MKNKKVVIIFIVIVIIVAIIAGIYKIMSSYLFTKENRIEGGNSQIIETIKSTDDYDEKKEQVDLLLEYNRITEQEAKELLEE